MRKRPRLNPRFLYARTMKPVALFAFCGLLVTLSGFRSSSAPGIPWKTYSEQRNPSAVLVTGSQSLVQHLLALRRAPSILSGAPKTESQLSIEDDIEGRGDWFTFQRIYPSNSIPTDARLRAWQSRTHYQLDSLIIPQAAKTWHPIGPSPTVSTWYPFWGATSGRVNSISVSPSNPNLVLIGSSTGGIWRSTDGGDSFVPVSDDQVDLAVGSLAFSKSNPSLAYAGMGDTKLGYLGSGVLKSTDEGKTWRRVSNTSLPSPGTIAKLEIDPSNPDKLYVAQYSRLAGGKITSSGVCLSVDGGVNWKRVLAGAPRDVVIHPGDSQVVYAGLSQIDKDADPPLGLYRSTDAGTTWSNLFTTPQYDLTKRRDFRIAVSPADPQMVYVYFGGFIGSDLDAQMRVSTDGGATWTDRSVAAVDTGQFGYNTYLAADPHDALTVYVGSRDVYRSTDGGASWTNITRNFYNIGSGFQYAPGGSATHPDQHAIAFSPIQNEFYLGNDGGVSKTTDGGDTFRSLNGSLTLSQFIGIALHPTNPSISYGGTQDNGGQQRSADSTWTEIVTGDGGHAVINPLDPSIVFMTYIRGDIYRFANDGRAFELQVGYNAIFGETFDDPRMAFYPPFTGNGVDSTLYFGTWRLFVSTNLGNSWFAPAGFLDLTKGITQAGRDVLSAIGVSRSNTNVIFTGSAQGCVMVSRNGGGSWSNVGGGLPDRFVTSITVDPSNASVAYLTVSGFNTGHVFKTTNTGTSWTDISGTLPDVPVSALLVDPVDSNTIYLGSDIGVFRSTTQGGDWRFFNRGMPPVVVHDFSGNAGGVIQVATYGRGAFELGANEPPSIVSVTFDGRKRLTIDGKGFGESATVLVNGLDRSLRISENSDTSILLTGKIKKLGLRSGDNNVQVITSDHLSSNVFTIAITL